MNLIKWSKVDTETKSKESKEASRDKVAGRNDR